MDNGRITGAEALLRWRHPRDGFVSPAQFILLAESRAGSCPIGEWALCRLRATGAVRNSPLWQGLTLAVNVSPASFTRAVLCRRCWRPWPGTGQKAAIQLEMTEGLLLADVEDTTIAKMSTLRS